MVTNPICKVNLGLYVTGRRNDGMHDLSTIFLPVVGLCDTLEIVPLDETYSCDRLHITGMALPSPAEDNIVLKTVHSLRKDYPQIPFLEIWLHKAIPTGAGLGGGSSDAAYCMKMLDEMFDLKLSDNEAINRLSILGADCPFFWKAHTAYAEGIGEELHYISIPSLKDYTLLLVKPPFGVSTREAFGGIVPQIPESKLQHSVLEPVSRWQETISNDFEKTVCPIHPEIQAIKETLQDLGVVYSQMSGSGSTVIGLLPNAQYTENYLTEIHNQLKKVFPKDYFVAVSPIKIN